MSQQPKRWFYHVSAVFITPKNKKPGTVRLKVLRTRFELQSTAAPNDVKQYVGQHFPEAFDRLDDSWDCVSWVTCKEGFVVANLKDYCSLLEFLATHYPNDRITKALMGLI